MSDKFSKFPDIKFIVVVDMCIEFKKWCDNHSWKLYHQYQRHLTNAELFEYWYNNIFQIKTTTDATTADNTED